MFITLYSAACLAVFTAWALRIVNTDLATRKIPNRQLYAGIKLLALALAVMAVNSLVGWSVEGAAEFHGAAFYKLLAAHAALSAAAGLILWYAEIWPAGDAKFFMVAAAWLPLINPSLRNFPDALFLVFLVNIFISAGLYAFGKFIAEGLSSAPPAVFFGQLWSDIKSNTSGLAGGGLVRARTALFLANMLLIFLVQQILAIEAFGAAGGFFSRVELLFFLLFFLWEKIARAFKSVAWTYLSAVFYPVYLLLGAVFFFDHMLSSLHSALVNMFKFGLLLLFGRMAVEFLMEKKDIVYLTADKLRPGVILSAKAARMLRDNPVFEGAFDDCFKDGLDEEQVAALKDWLGRLPGGVAEIETVRGRAFALWIFAGACLTLLLNLNLAKYIKL